MIIWLASYPRSGNTFFRVLLNNIYGIKTHSVYNDPLFNKLKGSSNVVGHQNIELSYEEMIFSEQLFFVKTHNLPSDGHPAIYLVRDGRDSLVSYAHYLISFHDKSLKKNWRRKFKILLGWNEYSETLNKLIVGSHEDYGNWSENVKQWMQRDADSYLVKFEDLVENPIAQVTTAIEKLNLQEKVIKKNDKVPSFSELHDQWPQFFRQGQVGKGRDAMSRELQDLFWKYHGAVMQEIGYKL